ncbi:porin [Prevotella sp. kh1p2]|uniref:porin n=1 Tax=Prevotella sp. kh1p2 TaxID=1761883 RepID=UPI0008C36CCE|nr:porin [Prevotella sp. kh1p2]SES92124.1 Phosphate-selective porin O and P [Prevotella sp. kh1p2]SNU11162.1 Phosphate-selective porin O and P [Prevotellaceae bacterium KH2P17]
MKHILLTAAMLGLALGVNAQGNNTGLGGNDGDYQSLAERVLKLEKKTDAFNVYFNYAASGQAIDDGSHWGTSFKNKQARIEIKGNLTDKLSYRFRHRLNKNNTAQSEDNFAKATDILMVGYQFNDKLGVQAGKMCQNWGGFEFDENPMYIYQYSDMVDNMDNFMAGVNISFKPVPTQEINLNVTDAYNNKFANEYGDHPVALANAAAVQQLEGSHNPLTYILLWNGSFFGNKLQTRWSWGIQTQARHKYSRMLVLGQKLNLPTVQWYLDYMGAFDGLDRLRIASSEGADFLAANNAGYFSDVHYNSFITKLNWQFAPQWNLMLKGMYETASVTKIEQFKNYRKSFGYIGSVEYYPVKSQDFRVFLAYVGRKYNYSEKSGLEDYNTNRIELGFMYRIKVF